jgi:diguanylate cyclase (GGDEF)-like protein
MMLPHAQFSYQDVEIPVTISIGVTEVEAADRTAETPLIRADNAMYQAKKDGRNRVCIRRKFS